MTDKFLKDFWAFVGTMRISTRNLRVYVGNRLLPTTLVIFSHKTLCKLIDSLNFVSNIHYAKYICYILTQQVEA